MCRKLSKRDPRVSTPSRYSDPRLPPPPPVPGWVRWGQRTRGNAFVSSVPELGAASLAPPCRSGGSAFCRTPDSSPSGGRGGGAAALKGMLGKPPAEERRMDAACVGSQQGVGKIKREEDEEAGYKRGNLRFQTEKENLRFLRSEARDD